MKSSSHHIPKEPRPSTFPKSKSEICQQLGRVVGVRNPIPSWGNGQGNGRSNLSFLLFNRELSTHNAIGKEKIQWWIITNWRLELIEIGSWRKDFSKNAKRTVIPEFNWQVCKVTRYSYDMHIEAVDSDW